MAKKKKEKSLVLPESVQAAMGSDVNGGDTPFGSYTGVFYDRRIKNCSEARSLYNQLQRENQQRALAFSQVRNQVEGGRPFDPQVLRKNGEEGRTNCNFNDARAAIMRATVPFWKMVHEVPRTISVTCHTQNPNRNQWSLIMEENFDRFLEDWGSDYKFQFQGMTFDMVQFGPSYPMFEDATIPRYRWVQAVQVLLPKRTKANIDDWELVCVRREMTASQLWAKVRNEKERDTSKKAGWNPEMVDKAIKMATPQSLQSRLLDPNYWQDLVQSNDLVIGGVWPPIEVVDMWVKEHDGKITHYIFTDRTESEDYLYEAKEEQEEFRHIFSPVFYDIGTNGLVHGIKGFGVRNYYYMTTINRMKCKAADAVGLTMGLNFTKDNDTPDEAPPVQNWSFFNVLPPGLTPITIYPQVQPAMQLMQSLQTNQNENNYTYSTQGTQEDIAHTDTKGQADLIASISAEGESSQAAIYLAQMAQLFSEIFRRLCLKRGNADAKKFQERCRAQGLPPEVLTDEIEKTVKCGASPTMASPAVRAKIGQTLMAMAAQPNMNFRAIQEFNVANLTGSEGVGTFMMPIGVNSDPRARREAMMENEDLSKGMPLPVDPNDDHFPHAEEHLKPLEMIVQQAQQGMNPQQVPGGPVNPPAQITSDHLLALQVVMPHLEEHLNYLAMDDTKAQIFKQLNARFKLVQNVANGIFSRLARAQRNGSQDMGSMNQAIGQPRQ